MSRETLYEIACEMLNTTNVFNKDVSELKHFQSRHEEVSLLNLVKKELLIHGHRYRGKSPQNIQFAFDAIVLAMNAYLESYPAPFSFKQKTKEKFVEWLKMIVASYSITGVEHPYGINTTSSETDTGVAILKYLHARNGTTVKEMAAGLGLTPRAIQKDLNKLSFTPSSKGEVDIRLRLGGQPLQAKIETAKDLQTKREITPTRYLTRNSVNPLVLQENIMQLATLLKSLCRQFCDFEDDSAKIIAVDIWSQMSAYAQSRIKTYYAYDNPDLSFFITLLEDDFPDNHACPYHTEREMLDGLETPLPVDQALPSLMKVENRTGVISLNNGKSVLSKRLLPTTLEDGSSAYKAIDSEGQEVIFTKNQVIEIEIV